MIAGKVALVTGGASGLGAAIARDLTQAGACVVIADRDLAAAVALADEIDAIAEPIDLADTAAAARLVENVADEHGLDILINNAGVDVTTGVEAMTQAEFDQVIAVNLRAPFALARAAFAPLRAAGGGHIVNIVSTAAKRAWANAAAYHASKWGLLGLSHALHVEGRPHNIRVTAIVAGGMRTPFILDRFPDTPLDVLQDPAAVAAAVRFAITQPGASVVPELTITPLAETSWP